MQALNLSVATLGVHFIVSDPGADNPSYATAKHGKIIDASHRNSYVLNSEVTELNLTKILHNIQR